MRPIMRSLFAAAAVLALLIGFHAGGSVRAQEPEKERFSRQIPASVPGWRDAGIKLEEGDTATVSAIGRTSWDNNHNSVGPEGVNVESCTQSESKLPVGSLMVRVGSRPAVVAPGAALRGPGKISFAYNDCPDAYFDNNGEYSATIEVIRAPIIAVTPEPAPMAAPPPAKQSGGFPIVALIIPLLLGVLGGGGYYLWYNGLIGASKGPRFRDSARLESSAWIAPKRLGDIQGERRPKKSLTVGGPDADIDFGLPSVMARFYPTNEGDSRIESAGSAGRVTVDGLPLALGQRLASGQRIRINQREFVFLEEHEADQPALSGGGGRRAATSVLDRADPRLNG